MIDDWKDAAMIRKFQIESGLDITFNKVFIPLFINKICKIKPNKIVEIGCGTGHLSKELSKFKYQITAIEPSNGMFKIAQDTLINTNIKLIKSDSFNFKECDYDLAFSHLVAHTVENFREFLKSIYFFLKSEKYFIFSIPHPCFYKDYKNILEGNYKYMYPSYEKISFKISQDDVNAISNVPYYHRPLSIYINTIIEEKFSIECLEEIYPSEDIQNLYNEKWKFPRYCLFMCKKINC